MLQGLLDEIIQAALQAVTGKSLDKWVAEIFEAMGLAAFSAKFPGEEQLNAAYDALAAVGENITDSLLGYYTDIQQGLLAFTDPRYGCIGVMLCGHSVSFGSLRYGCEGVTWPGTGLQ